MRPSALGRGVLLATAAFIRIASAQDEPADSFMIRDVRLFDGARASEHRSVIVIDGEIARVGGRELDDRGLDVVEGNGRTLLPGLFDAHVHVPGFDPAAALAQSAAFGVTTVIDMFSAGESLEKIKQLESLDDPRYAAVMTAGTGATAPGGHPSQMIPVRFETIEAPEDAQAFVDARIAEGSDFIKIIYDDLRDGDQSRPMIDRATLEAVVEAAHRRGLMAIAHIATETQAREAIEAGVDGLAHLFNGARPPADFGSFAARHEVFVIPTITVLHLRCGRSDGPSMVDDQRLGPLIAPQWRTAAGASFPGSQSCASIEATLRQLADAQVPLLTGTDAAVPGTAYGASVHVEMASMVEYGMSPLEALIAATSAPAGAFRLNDRGSIAPGMRADLLLVEGDPTENITDTRNIVQVWKKGVPVRGEPPR